MLPTHGVNSVSRTVAHGHRSKKISVGGKLSGGLCVCLRQASSSSLITRAQLWKTTSTLVLPTQGHKGVSIVHGGRVKGDYSSSPNCNGEYCTTCIC